MKKPIIILSLLFVFLFNLRVIAGNQDIPKTHHNLVVFSSNDGAALGMLKKGISLATNNIKIAMYTFTNVELADALTNAAARGVSIMLILDKGQAATPYSCKPMLTSCLGSNRVFNIHGRAGKYSLMHDKFMIVDNKIVFTGSYNWTKRANTYNWENFIIINDEDVAKTYGREFMSMIDFAKK
jgi:phosphatidylserine/phosphatidylglycerophosphate/cardiolipin synthase-like enzyme